MKLIALICICFAVLFESHAKSLFEYSSDSPFQNRILLIGRSILKNNTLILNGRDACGQVPGSEPFNISESGATILVTLKLNAAGTEMGTQNAHDMFVSKNNQFIFGRNQGQLYFNLFDGKNWCAMTVGGRAPAPGEWAQLAVVVQRVNDPAQADIGYKIMIYKNGELQTTAKYSGIVPAISDGRIEIGNGFGGGPWFMDGCIAEVAMLDGPLSEGELFNRAQKSPFLKIGESGKPIPANLIVALDNFLSGVKASSQHLWLAECFRRAFRQGVPEEEILALLNNLAPVSVDPGEMIRKIGREKSFCTILETPAMQIFCLQGTYPGATPLMGIWDRRNQRELLGSTPMKWMLAFEKKGAVPATSSASDNRRTDIGWGECRQRDYSVKSLDFFTPENSVMVSSAKQLSSSEAELDISWSKQNELPFEVKSRVFIRNSRLEFSFTVENRSNQILAEATFPEWTFAPLPGNDTLLYPWLTGILISDPMKNRFVHGQEGIYPSYKAVVQFGAYYNDAGGVYFAFEDPAGNTKQYSSVGRRNELYVGWKSFVAQPPGELGIRKFAISGKAVIELFDGDWYDAAMIYRKFLEQGAEWWIPELPRKSTPAWLRNNTLWFVGWGFGEEQSRKMADDLIRLRQYFELPLGVHWYGYDADKNNENNVRWPHFVPQRHVRELIGKMQQNDIRVKPYINSRLWSVADRQTGDFPTSFEPDGMSWAARLRDGSMMVENYGNNCINAIMCPVASGWQNTVSGIVRNLKQDGFDMIYHDQVGTSMPIICFSSLHGHPIGGGNIWRAGYKQMFESFRDVDIAHDTEENMETCLDFMDGFMIWRATNPGQVPMFQAIYSGRIQFTGRLYNHDAPGDPESFYAKSAEQLIAAEQIGWFPISELAQDPEKRKFIKKLIHLRQYLLPFFNAGKMEKPLTFQKKIPTVSSKWGAVGTATLVTTPQVRHSLWSHPSGKKIAVFVNTADAGIEIEPIWPDANRILHWGTDVQGAEPAAFAGRMSIPPRGCAILGELSVEESKELAVLLNQIGGFDGGQNLDIVKQ